MYVLYVICHFSQQLKKETLEKLAAFCKGPEYPMYVRKLIIQGLIKIEENDVQIQCRQEDKAMVSKLLPEAVAEFKALMAAAGHPPSSPKVSVSNTPLS